MAKTLPQLVKIERANPEQVVAHVEPYSWQKASKPAAAQPDPWETPTVRLTRSDADALAKPKSR
jgi:hypothetical protein